MADGSIDVLMRMVANKTDMAADSLTTFTTSIDVDELRKDFRAGYFCDLIDFSFSAGAEGSMSKTSKEKQKRSEDDARKKAEKEKEKANAKPTRWTKSNELLALDLVQQQRRRAGKRLDAENVDMQPVEYTRVMDSASTLLFKALVGCETLDRISIVKRKAAGAANSGLCYLRLDFDKVLITKLDFKDEQNVIHESGTFIYRALTVQYRPQLPSGALGATISTSWTMKGAATS